MEPVPLDSAAVKQVPRPAGDRLPRDPRYLRATHDSAAVLASDDARHARALKWMSRAIVAAIAFMIASLLLSSWIAPNGLGLIVLTALLLLLLVVTSYFRTSR